ncbi:MFS transporter [Actinoplanes sp. NPDC051343]|uniref:MFS transporter n=1 Tax=Actinoplanes sp. NPDC051343 TaxID=3363906 RepID=UPI00379C3945
MNIGKNRPLRKLLLALAVSQLGDWLYNLALVAFVYDRTHSVTWTALTTAARVVPMVLLGPLGGVLADRYDRRRLMIASDAVRLATMLLLAVVATTGLPILLAPILAAASTAASSVYPPAVAATVSRMVGDRDLPAATAARSMIQSATVIAGPAGGALLLALGSPALAFGINAASFAASAVVLLTLPGGALFAPGGRSAGEAGLRAGARALWTNRLASRLVGADILCSLLYGAQTVLLLLLGHRFGHGDAGYGLLLAGYGVGGLAGAALAARLASVRRPVAAVATTLLVVATCSGLFAVVPWFAGAVALAVLVGGGSVVVEVLTDTLLARSLDEAVLARAYGLAYPASIGGIVLGSLIAAPLVAVAGLGGALIAVGAPAAAYVLIFARRTGSFPAVASSGA